MTNLGQPTVTLEDAQRTLRVAGEISFDNAPVLMQTGERLIRQLDRSTPLIIDARHVAYSSSATLTLILAWWRILNAAQMTLESVLLPEKMAPLVALSGLDVIFPRH